VNSVQFPYFFSNAVAFRNCACASSKLLRGNDMGNFACDDFAAAIRKFTVQEQEEGNEDCKIRKRRGLKTKALSKDIHKRLELIDNDVDRKLQTLGYIFSGTQDCPEEFQ
jgi:hypothetical protein